MGCTLLERLILRFCTIYAPDISSQTLRVLTIDDQCYCTYFEGQATISIPSLISLHLSASGRVPLLKNMESLVTTSVSICDDDTQVDDIHCFLLALSGVTDLEFNYKGDMLTMENDLDWCPKFNNLTKLTLGEWCLHANFYALIVFLQNSPNLVKLTLKFVQEYHIRFGRFLGNLEERSFTCKHLQTVCLDSLKDDLVINSIKFFLDNGITSDKICIL